MTMETLNATIAGLLRRTVDCLQQGGVVLLPTDTVYGLAVLPDQETAIARLFDIKSRPISVNLPVMIANLQQLTAIGAEINPSARRLLESELMPGALSVILAINTSRAPAWLKHREEIAVRMPDDAFLLSLISETGPILATSANRHGCNTPSLLENILVQLEHKPDLAIDGGQVNTIPSTVVNCRYDPPTLERAGVVPAEEIDRIVNDR